MTGIYQNNGRLRVKLSFAEKCQFRSKTPFSQPLRNAFRSCELSVTVLRSGTCVPKSLSQLRNTLWNGTFIAKSGLYRFADVSQLRNGGSCVAKWHSCAKLAFAAAKILAEKSKVLRNGLATKCSFRRSFSLGCEISQSSVFTLFSIRFFFFQFLCNFFHLGSFKKIKTHIKT